MPRYDLTDLEWRFLQPILPSKVRGVKRRDDRQVLNGIFYVLRTGCPWRDLPGRYGPFTTVYNRCRRWTLAGVWDRIMDAVVDDWSLRRLTKSLRRPIDEHRAF